MATSKFGEVTSYENFVLSNAIEDAFKSHLDLQQFVTVDNDLQGAPGMEKHVNVYTPSGEAETVAEGEGNTKKLAVGLTEKVYKIATSQAEFEYTDEREMIDPNAVAVGADHLATAMFNDIQKQLYAEFAKATLGTSASPVATPNFDAFVDATAALDLPDINATAADYQAQAITGVFGILNRADLAKVRKALGDNLKYVEAYARAGYVGTVAGVNLYVKQDATEKTITIATKKAVTLFNKTGVELENITKGKRSEVYADKRKNLLISRKYYVAALTDATQAYSLVLA